jgi:cytochrome c553
MASRTTRSIAIAIAVAAAWPARAGENRIDFFESRIRPLLAESCYGCHSARAKKLQANLRLDTREGVLGGGDNGPALVPGKPEESLILKAVSYRDADLQMPPRKKLEERQIADLRRWIELGAPDPRVGPSEAAAEEGAAQEGAAGRERTGAAEPFDLEARKRSHWAWQPLGRPAPPAVRDPSWPRADLDRFIQAEVEAAGLAPAPPADRRTYLRRVSFDLTGLAPSLEELATFLADPSSRAFEDAVDRLLESPHFGEHWGQHWLDLVRYGETRGHEQDFEIPEAWRYRDYVIRAFNADVPYDLVVREHVAGDLLESPRLHPETRADESLQGTGFWHLGEATHSPVDIRGDEADRVHNQIDVFSKTFLGLSVGCARCHEHKFDAISQEDYYALYGYLRSSSYRLADTADPRLLRELVAELAAERARHGATVAGAYAALARRQLERLPLYLLAAAGEAPEAAGGASQGSGLEPGVVEALKAHLEKAAGDPGEPLHAFALAAREPDGTQRAARVEEVRASWRRLEEDSRTRLAALEVVQSTKDGEHNYTRHARAFSEKDVAVDFGSAEALDWLPSGHRFGAGPLRPGAVVLGSAERPIAWIAGEGAAASDVLSGRLTGMLRTRTFEVTADTLWYRVRGSGEIFLAVDSHRVVSGPLHGAVKLKLEGDAHTWRWQSQNVRDYIGHRVHAELLSEKGLAVSKILFAASAPPDGFTANPLIERTIAAPGADSLATLAVLTGRAFLESVEALAGNVSRDGEAGGDRDATHGARGAPALDAGAIRLLNWLLDHPHLLEPAPALSEDLARAFAAWSAARDAIERRLPPPAPALALLDGTGEDEPLHIRGNHRNLSRAAVPRRFLAAVAGRDPPPPARGSGRLELARLMTDPEKTPLVPRVMVNRIWHHLFGRGLVETVDDFGVMGKAPSHPELLDHLSRRFIERGWSVKAMVREVVLSSTYRMSSRPRAPEGAGEDGDAVDPDNRLLHRMSIRRLPAEAIRDHLLAVSGRLDRRMFGKSVPTHITPFQRGDRSPGASGPLDGDGRRSIYLEVRRNHLSPMLLAFDKPIPFMTLGKRGVSNSPAQPLILLNDPFVHEQAGLWARRLLALEGRSDAERIERAYLEAFARPPDAGELDAALRFLTAQAAMYDGDAEAAWKDLCHTLMNVKELIFLG